MGLPGNLFLTYLASPFFFLLAPGILRRYPHPYTFALANACAWAGGKVQQGQTSFTFFIAFATVCGLAVKAYRWITGASAPTTASEPAPTPMPAPAELEDGLAVLEAEVGPAPSTASPSPAFGTFDAHAWTVTLLILLLLSAPAFVWLLVFVHHDIMSGEKSLLENIGALALWILHGWQVVFVLGLLMVLAAYVQEKRRSAAAEAEPTEVLEEQDTSESAPTGKA
ncbi:hypothetical protein C8R44DRAFT_759578 [Mycena epipterygia]|nr:hypothetical protein C8R44DRAFT_759578 [Mycena epipterygia]